MTISKLSPVAGEVQTSPPPEPTSGTTLVFESARTGKLYRITDCTHDHHGKDACGDTTSLDIVLRTASCVSKDNVIDGTLDGLLYSDKCVKMVIDCDKEALCSDLEERDTLLCELIGLDRELHRLHGDLFDTSSEMGKVASETICQLQEIRRDTAQIGPDSLHSYCSCLAQFLQSIPTSSSSGHRPVRPDLARSLNSVRQRYQEALHACIDELLVESKQHQSKTTGITVPIVPRFSVTTSIGAFPEYALRRNGGSAARELSHVLTPCLPVSPKQRITKHETESDEDEDSTEHEEATGFAVESVVATTVVAHEPREVVAYLRSAHDLLASIDDINQYRNHCTMAHYLLCHHTWVRLVRQRTAQRAALPPLPPLPSSIPPGDGGPGRFHSRRFTVGTWNMAHVNMDAQMQRFCPGRIDVFREELIRRISPPSLDTPACMAVCIQECTCLATLEAMVRDTPFAIMMKGCNTELPVIYNAAQWDCTMSDYRPPTLCGLKHGVHIVKFRHRSESVLSMPAVAMTGSVVPGHEVTLINAHLTPCSAALNQKETAVLQDIMLSERRASPSGIVIGLADANVCSDLYDHRSRWFGDGTEPDCFLTLFENHVDPECGTALLDSRLALSSSRGSTGVPRLYDVIVSSRVDGLHVNNVKTGFCANEHRIAYECKRRCHAAAEAGRLLGCQATARVAVHKVVFGDHQPVFATVELPSVSV